MLDVNLKMLNVKMNENVLFFDIAAYLVNNGSSKGPLKAGRLVSQLKETTIKLN